MSRPHGECLSDLLLGKPIGVVLASWIGVRFGIARLPGTTTWRQMVGVGLVAGIGFTMSIFIADLAFTADSVVDHAKVGIFIASILAGAVGYYVLRGAEPKAPQTSLVDARIYLLLLRLEYSETTLQFPLLFGFLIRLEEAGAGSRCGERYPTPDPRRAERHA